jgi:DNA-binding SARP family transcriptional activator/tetratricopeptide (TPR) repeat protein
VTRGSPGGGRTEPGDGRLRTADGDMPLTVALLGPLMVSVAGRPVAVTSERLRSVLAVLALSVGEPVSVGRLAAAVWGDDQPADARSAVQVYVARLRNVLGQAAIRTVTSGYLLDAAPASVDAARFVGLLDAAAQAPDEAAERTRLVEALGLWRDTPFADLKSPWLAEVESTRLLERYLAGLERLIDTDIANGRSNEVVVQLRELTARYPLRERFWAQLMQALSQTDRRAEALGAYERLCQLLADELGVEPSRSMHDLHREILMAEVERNPRHALSAPHAPSAHAVVAIPRQLPADVAAFAGRRRELAEFDRLPDADAVVIAAIDGMAGVGKTALAIHAAHQLADRFPDGQMFIDLHGYTEGMAPVDPSDALDRMLRALGVPGEQIAHQLEERSALFRSTVADRSMLFVLDNAVTEAQVAPLLPGAPGSLVLITSRHRLAGLDQTHTVSLDCLSPHDAVSLFVDTVGAQCLAGEASDRVAEVVDLCGRLPLAVRIAAARLRSHPSWTVAHLLDRFREQRDRLSELEAGQRSVGAALDLSYQHLDEDQQRFYRLLGLHPGPDLDEYTAAALTDTPPGQARRLLDHLLDAHLLQEPAPGRYRFHDLTRAHAVFTTERTDAEPDRRAASARQLTYYGQTAATAMDLLYPSESDQRPRVPSSDIPDPALCDAEGASVWLDTELPSLVAAAEYAAEHGWPHHIQHLSSTLHRHLRTRGWYTVAEKLHGRALAAGRSTGDPSGQALALTDLGHIHRRQGRNDEAIDDFQQALDLARAIGNQRAQVTALNGLARVMRRQGRHEQATHSFEQALDIARAIEDRAGQAEALNGLGDTFWARGRQEEAAHSFEQALEVARASGDRIGYLDALNALGHIHRRQGRYTQATENFVQALAIASGAGPRSAELSSAIGLGDVHRLQGRREQAIGNYEHALHLAQEIGDRNWQFEAAQGLGRLQETSGQSKLALTHHRQALDLATELGQPDDEARAHDGLAQAYHALGQHQQARHHWQQALRILAALGTDHTDDEAANVPAIRDRLAELDRRHPERPDEGGKGAEGHR